MPITHGPTVLSIAIQLFWECQLLILHFNSNSNIDQLGIGLGAVLNSQSQNQMSSASHHISQQVSPELSEALRFQEQRIEQALRMHGNDPRALGFALGAHQQASAHNQ